ncbi:MAG: cadherin-like domain-containing protein, partial [Planctomycetota bacterium]|nr:cadherin-like domain-containing protein [Planctomycetota bacterium]
MRRTTLLFVIGLMTLALPLTGCGGSSSFASNSANQDVLSLSPQPFFGAFSLPFTLTGTNFASVATPPGSTVTIRFTATSGTPFLGGTSATVEIPGTVVDPTTIAGDSPLALVSGTVTATVTVVLPSGQEFASTGAIATFVGIQVDSVTPGSAPSEIPTALTVNGDGFGPTGGVAAVRFFVDTGTPFLGGTAAFLDLPGTILSQTAIAIAASPVAGIAADTPVRVRVTLPAGANGASAGPIFTFLAPRVTSAAPSAVFSQLPTLVTLTGSGFGPPAATPTITLRATTGTPFAGGTLDTLSVTGTVVNPTTITFTTPIANVLVAVNPVVEVAFASGAVGTGASGILQIDPAVVTTVAPLLVPADTATPITLTGNGFGPTGACTVTFRADMGTPFLGGTAASISVAGTVVNPTTLTCTTPVTGLANRLLPAIDLIFSTGGGGGSASGLLTFEPRPDAVDDPSYTTVGNVDLTVPAATGVLANDSDPDGDMISVTAFDATGTQGGAVSVAADGSFTYNPPAGFEGTDTFTYTIADPAGLTDSATVTITISDVVWFIDEDATVAGDGRLASPFDTLAAFLASPLDEVDDYIYLYESATTYAGQLTLLDGQQLSGQGVALVVGGSTIVPAAGTPTLGAAGGTALTLASGNTVRGLDLTNTSGQALAGTSVGAFSADTVALDATGGAAIEITTGALSVTFDSITTLNAPSDGIDLVDCTGTFAVTGATAVTGSGNDGINIQGQSAGASTTAFTFSTITINGAAQDGICLNNHDGGFIVTGTTTITDPPAGPSTDYGIDIVDSNPSATWSFGPILISDVVDSGIRARNTVGTNGITFASVGIDRAGQHGIEIANGSAPFTFASLDIDTTGDDGLSISNKGGSLEVTGTAAFANTGNDILTPGADHGVDINGGSCDYTFADLDITDSHGHGVLLTSTTGTFVCSDGDITRPDEMGFSAVTCTGTITLGA